jgi:hypothetical protein
MLGTSLFVFVVIVPDAPERCYNCPAAFLTHDGELDAPVVPVPVMMTPDVDARPLEFYDEKPEIEAHSQKNRAVKVGASSSPRVSTNLA